MFPANRRLAIIIIARDNDDKMASEGAADIDSRGYSRVTDLAASLYPNYGEGTLESSSVPAKEASCGIWHRMIVALREQKRWTRMNWHLDFWLMGDLAGTCGRFGV